MRGIEMNVQTGERKVIDLTPEEVADTQARTAVETAENAARIKEPDLRSVLRALIKANVITQEQIDIEIDK